MRLDLHHQVLGQRLGQTLAANQHDDLLGVLEQVHDCLARRVAAASHLQIKFNRVHYEGHVAALEDKIVQRAVVAVLNAIYEADFLGFSYGFRPERGTHDAVDALVVGISSKKVSWRLDADIRSFLDDVS